MKCLTSLLLVFFVIIAGCQNTPEGAENKTAVEDFPYIELSLSNTNDFNFSNPQHNNWSIAGKVFADRNINGSLEASPGSGILANKPDSINTAELFTTFEHGDLDLELDFMISKGSNSGIYLQGRYEVQLLDSWLKDSLKYGDCAGIYTRIADGKPFGGNPPLTNASKAPGLWQHLKIHFRAPRFDQAGNKIENARFNKVYLNGALVQKDVEVSGPTQSAAFTDEKPMGPLEIQGSHGPVAFRNIRYKSYISDRIQLQDMQVKVYKSFYDNIDTLKELVPDRILTTDTLSQLSYEKSEQAIHIGKMIVPISDEYKFMLRGGGPVWLMIDSMPILNNDTSDNYNNIKYKTIHLDSGAHSFALIYNKRYNSMDLGYEGPKIPFTFLTTINSGWVKAPIEPYIIPVENETIVQRGFMMHDTVKRTHAIAVGIPGGINYAYSLTNFNIFSAWRGGFVDAADMWRQRGEAQLEQPLGGIIELSGAPALQVSGNNNSQQSVTAGDSTFTNSGYSLLKNQLPVFFYTFNGTEVKDYIHPDANKQGLTREMTFSFPESGKEFQCTIAEGSQIGKLPDGSYAMNDYSYYISKIDSNGQSPEIIKTGQGYALIVLVKSQGGKAVIRYDMIW